MPHWWYNADVTDDGGAEATGAGGAEATGAGGADVLEQTNMPGPAVVMDEELDLADAIDEKSVQSESVASSVDASFCEMMHTKPGTSANPRNIQSLDMSRIVDDLSVFSSREDVAANGQCGVSCVQKALTHHHEKAQSSLDSVLRQELNPSFAGNNVFRRGIRDFLEQQYVEMTNPAMTMYIDECGAHSNHFTIETDAKGHNIKNMTLYGPSNERCNNVQYKMDCIYSDIYFSGLSGNSVTSRFWIDAHFFLPAVCAKYQVSVILYNQNGNRKINSEDGSVRKHSVGRTTTAWVYCDGVVKSFHFDEYRMPFRGAVSVFLSGKHFNWLKYHDDFDDWAPSPVIKPINIPTLPPDDANRAVPSQVRIPSPSDPPTQFDSSLDFAHADDPPPNADVVETVIEKSSTRELELGILKFANS